MSTGASKPPDLAVSSLIDKCAALQKENYELKQRIFAAEKKLSDTTNSLKDECARERARYRALEAKMDEFQLATEKSATKRVEDLMTECSDMRANLLRERDRNKAIEQELDALSSYASERINLTRRLEIAESRVADLEVLLEVNRKQFLAEAAEQRAILENRHKTEIQAAVEKAIRDTNESISTETQLLREQNQMLQKSILVLKNNASTASSKRTRTLSRLESDVGLTNRSRTVSQLSLVKASISDHIGDEDVDKFEADINRGFEVRIGELKLTIKNLQAKLDQQTAQYKQDKNEASDFIANLISKFNKERSDLLFEIKTLEKLVYAKCKELYKLRTLAQIILQRRTDLEAFLSKLLSASLNLETRSVSPYAMSAYFDIGLSRHRSPSPSPPPDYRSGLSAAPRSISPEPIMETGMRTRVDTDSTTTALASLASKIPRSMAEMERTLNTPIRVRSDSVINALTADEIANIVRDWVARIDIPM